MSPVPRSPLRNSPAASSEHAIAIVLRPRQSAAAPASGTSTARTEWIKTSAPIAGAGVKGLLGHTKPRRENHVSITIGNTLAVAAATSRTSAARRHPSVQTPARVPPVASRPRSRTPQTASAATWRGLGRVLPDCISASVPRISSPRSRRYAGG
jgi:hypothetical protein